MTVCKLGAILAFLIVPSLLISCVSTPKGKSTKDADPRIENAFKQIERTRSLAEYKAATTDPVLLMADRVDRDAVYVTVGEDKGTTIRSGQYYKVTLDGAVFRLNLATDAWTQQTDILPEHP